MSLKGTCEKMDADLTIAAAASLSDATVDMGGGCPVKLVIDAWDAAAMTFDVSMDGDNFYPLLNKDGEVTIADPNAIGGDAAKVIALNPADMTGVRYMKVRSGVEGTELAQGAAVTIEVWLQEIVP